MRRYVIGLCLILTLVLLAACSPAAIPDAAATPAPDRLDLSNSGITDVGYLKEYTWLSQLNLKGNEISAADFDALAAALPDCEILWSVPFAGKRLDSDTTTRIREMELSAEDVRALDYFGALESVYARRCADYAALAEVAARRPDVDFLWTLKLGTRTLTNLTASLDLNGETLTIFDIKNALPGLPALKELQLQSLLVADMQKRELIEAYPDIRFGWLVEVLPGVMADSAEDKLVLSGHTVTDVDALVSRLNLLPGLKQVDMCECGLDNAQMLRIREALPAAKVVWMIDAGGYRIRTDIKGFSVGVITRFPNGGGYRTGDGGHGQEDGSLDELIYCTDIVALDIGHCTKISDISFIAQMPKLQYLIIAMTNISDISVLADQTELIYLEIFDDYGITDITPLRNCKKLRYLNCSATNFTEIETLLGLKKLERLWITCSELTDEQLEELQKGLPNTRINDARDRYVADSLWRKGNWGYVDMQRIYGMRAQFQGGVSPTPAPPPTPTP